MVLAVERALDLLAQDRLIEQVLHSDADASDLVAVGRADAASGRADLRLAQETLGDLVEGDVVRRDEVRIGADDQLRRVNATLVQRRHLLQQDCWVDDDTIADHRHDRWREDATGQQVEGELLVTDDDGMTGVVTALVANDVVHAAA